MNQLLNAQPFLSAASFTLAAGLQLAAQTAGAAIAQQAYLKASNTSQYSRYGNSVAMSGDTAVVAAYGESNGAEGSGAAYVFVRNGTAWKQQAYLKASYPDVSDAFGSSVAISGDTVVVGAYGESSSASGVDGDQSDNSAPWAGAAYVFVRNGTNWSQQAYLKASNTDSTHFFGMSVALSGDTAVVGAPYKDSAATDSGAAYIFVRNGTNWTQQAFLKASNTGTNDEFGVSVAISGDIVVIGAAYESSNATGVNGNQSDDSAVGAGAAYVFVRNGTTWTQQAYLKASNPGTDDHFGEAVAVSGDTVVVGAHNESSAAGGVNGVQSDNSAFGAGAAYVFVRDGTNWSQQAYLKASNPGGGGDGQDGDWFGGSVGVSGETVVVGAHNEDSNARGVNGNQSNNSLHDAGAAYVFIRNGTTWTQQAYLKASNTGLEDYFGFSVVVSGGTVVVGAAGEYSSAIGVNGNQNNDSAPAAGAAYVFTGVGISPPTITIARSAQNVTLSWPVSATDYILEATAALPAVSWTTVTNNPTVTATNRSVQLPLTGPAQFFRLRKP